MMHGAGLGAEGVGTGWTDGPAAESGWVRADATLESAAECIGALKADAAGDAFHCRVQSQKSPPRIAQPQLLNKIRRSAVKNLLKDAAKMARTKAGPRRQVLDRHLLVQMG